MAPAPRQAQAPAAWLPAAPAEDDLAALLQARHGNPFGVLGPHRVAGGWAVRVMLPGAWAVQAVAATPGATGDAAEVLAPLQTVPGTALWCGMLPGRAEDGPPAYRLHIDWGEQAQPRWQTLHDAYAYGPQLREADLWLLAEGSHLRPYEALGAHPLVVGPQGQGVGGVRFAVWAPSARRVSVVGDFNGWDGRRHAMRHHPASGVWEIFVPDIGEGARYKFELLGADGRLRLKADPYANQGELRPATASVVRRLPAGRASREDRRRANALDAPISCYEVHLGAWRRRVDGGWLSWAELAEQLIPYAAGLGFTHLELLPVQEHPFDGSWGYQPTGLYAPTVRYGEPEGFAAFVDAAHAAGLGVILDWVPAHFPSDEHGLAQFDGTALYEHQDPREGYHPDWNTLIYNFGRTEVRNFLIGNALYWIERYGMDGLRVDAVASMLYRDYSRGPGQWVPNRHGGRENLEAIDFLRRLNHTIGVERPEAVMIAEESTSFPGVSRPPSPDLQGGGLGFHYKWNMGWMNDTLRYMAREAVHRPWHQDELRFSLMYAFNENFVLPLSHDEVVHGKGSMLRKMPGDDWQRFANLRAYYGYLWGHPGKKLLFMGCEFGQWNEWSEQRGLDWHLLEQAPHAGVQRLVRDLNNVLRHFPALHQQDVSPEGFRWIRHDDAAHSVLAFERRAADGSRVVVISHFTPVVRHGYRLGLPQAGRWREVINTDLAIYGGSGVGSGELHTADIPCDGWPQSVSLTLPPLATLMLVCDAPAVPLAEASGAAREEVVQDNLEVAASPFTPPSPSVKDGDA
ncbi:1,4-alpha-glucan branching protein GlgB [Ideonella livida]|uniref:1,4-alpha-glucan branching enzyme GlgB n=1 Tax=Ideonella livida TaxID=2707176 RepID=A0A7C9TI08_9BURK|nr:1,4-alpha-glucan branching protein GlgB [Ideonella livida]NDY90064.1 1,4-alpha-glucan branching protein GlgB [Ideonella livida]